MNVTFGNHFMFPMNSQYCCLSISKNLEKKRKKSIKTNQKRKCSGGFIILSTYHFIFKFAAAAKFINTV